MTKDEYVKKLEEALSPFACLVDIRVLDAPDEEVLFVNKDSYGDTEDRVVTCGDAKRASTLLNSQWESL